MKKITLASLCLLMILALTACGTKSQNQNQSPQANMPGGRRMPDFGQPKTPPSFSGVVKSITGNEVVILKIDRPAGMGGRNASSTPDTQGGQRPASISLNGSNGGARNFGGGMNRGNFNRSGENGQTDQAARLEELKKMSTGEETIIIPVGIQMLKRDDSSQDKPSMVAASLDDIKQDSMLRIWLDESVSDRKVAKFVIVN